MKDLFNIKSKGSIVHEYRYQILFVALMANILMPGFFGVHNRIAVVTPLLNILLLFGSFLVIQKLRKFALYALAFGVLGASSNWLDDQLRFWGVLVFAIYFIIVAYELFSGLLSKKEIGFKDIVGALDGYLMIGFIGSLLMLAIHIIYDQAFANVLPGMAGACDIQYFSYVTLSTIGYGDIVPLIPAAKGAVLIVGLMGQIYLVVVIAAFVGRFITRAKPID